MSEFVLTRLENGQAKLAFVDHDHTAGALVESVTTRGPCIWIGLENHHKLLLNQEMVKALLPYLQEFAATGHFGRRPIQRAFTDSRIERLAESDPLLASVRRHILHVTDDDTAPVRALVRLLTAYSETLAETLAQLKSAVPAWSRGLEGTVFERGKEYLGDE